MYPAGLTYTVPGVFSHLSTLQLLEGNAVNTPEKTFRSRGSGFLYRDENGAFLFQSSFHLMVSFSLDNLENLIQDRVGAFYPVNALCFPGLDRGFVYGIGGSAPVSMYQTASSQECSTEVPDHHDEHIGKVSSHDLAEYGFSGS